MPLIRYNRPLIILVVSVLQRLSFCSYRLVPPMLSPMVHYDFQFPRPMFLLPNCVYPPYFPNNSERKPASPRLRMLTASLRCRRDLYKKFTAHRFNEIMVRTRH